MDRHEYLDLDLECEGGAGGAGGGGVAQKAALFGGMFKKSSKTAESTHQTLQENSELSRSSDSLTENTNKEKVGVFKGVFKKTSKAAKDEQLQVSLTGSSDSVSDSKSSVEKSGVFSGLLKRSPKPGHARRPSQDLLDQELNASNDNLSENTTSKGVAFRKTRGFGFRTQSQEDLLSSGGKENVPENTKESVFSGIFRKPKGFGARTQSQDDLSEPPDLSSSNDNISENTKEKGGVFRGMFKKKVAKSQSQDDLSGDSERLTEKPSKNGFSGMMKSTFYSDKQDKNSNSDADDTSDPESHKQSKLAEAMEKINPFRSAHKKEAEDREKEKLVEETTKLKKKEERSETPTVPPRPTKEEMKRTTTYNQSEDDDDKPKPRQTKPTRVKKHHNPFMPRSGPKLQAPSDDEEEEEEEEQEENKDEEEEQEEQQEEQQEEEEEEEGKVKVKKPKRHNPFMPRKPKPRARNPEDVAAAENEGANRSLFDQLEDFRINPAQPEDGQDFETLMNWWRNVEAWEDTPQDDDMTEKEEAKAFAVTAEKVQKGIRVFNKLFSERAESLWQHVIDLNGIADGLDKFSKNTKIAQITGGSTSAIGGVATITGLALAPVTMGVSLIVTAVGLGVATAGGLTSAGAGISNQVNNSMDRKKVEKIVTDYQEKMLDLNKCLKFIKQGIENLKKFDLLKMKKHAYNRDFPVLSSSFYEDGAMAGKAILINANEIMRVVQIANVAGSTAARAVQIASMATGVLTGLFVGMDIYFVAKDSKELKKGAKSEFAAKIREVATQLHDGLVELNSIREELQSTAPEGGGESAAAAQDGAGTAPDGEKKEEVEEDAKQVKDAKEVDDSSSEDEIDRIKKAIKKDYENREYV